jgi:hypothetical protein
MDESPIAESRLPDHEPAQGEAERQSDLSILEGLEVELAEVEAALQRLDARVDATNPDSHHD